MVCTLMYYYHNLSAPLPTQHPPPLGSSEPGLLYLTGAGGKHRIMRSRGDQRASDLGSRCLQTGTPTNHV